MILIEFTGSIDSFGTTQTFYLATESYTTKPTDNPPDQEFKSRLIDPGAISLSIYIGGSGAIAGGSAKLDIGEIIATNIDGEFDALKDYSFDGRDIIMRTGEPGGVYPNDYPPILRASMESIDVGWDQIVIKVRDQTYVFNKPILSRRFLGNNALPNGLEGTADDIKGQIVPRTYGFVEQIAPKLVNTAKDTYRVNDGPVVDIPVVNVRGEPMTKIADYADSTALQSATVLPGEYHTCLVEGLFRLGAVDGLVTCDVVECIPTEQSAPNLLSRLALQAGVDPNRINQFDVSTLYALNSAPTGRYIDDETSYLQVMDEIAKSVGAWYSFDQIGNFRMGRLDLPQGTPVATLEEYEIDATGIQRSVIQEIPKPLWSVTINHTPIGEVQTTDLAGDIPSDRRAFLANKTRSATYQDSTIKNQFLLADSLTIDTLLMDELAAQNESFRKFNLHKNSHDLFTVPVPQSRATELLKNGLWLGGELGINLSRFDLLGGKSFIVLGLDFQRRAKDIVFSLWRNNVEPTTRIASAIAYAVGFSTVSLQTQDATGIAAADFNITGLGTFIGVGSTITSVNSTGTPLGLLLGILKPLPTDTSGAVFTTGRATVGIVGVSISPAVVTANGLGTAAPVATNVGGASTVGRPTGLLLGITKAT